VWYKASSVIAAVFACGKFFLDKGEKKPNCPKSGNNILCLNSFPDCDGKTKACEQKLRLVNEKGNPATLYFNYYLTENERDGRIKRRNSTLSLLIKKYGIDENSMIPFD